MDPNMSQAAGDVASGGDWVGRESDGHPRRRFVSQDFDELRIIYSISFPFRALKQLGGKPHDSHGSLARMHTGSPISTSNRAQKFITAMPMRFRGH